MKRFDMQNALVLIAAVIGLAAVGSLDIVRAEGKEQPLRGRIIAVGIPGASAISAVGTFLAGGPIHDDPAFAAYTQSGRILDPVRLLVGSRSNFGAPVANSDQYEGAFLSIDPRGTEALAIPPGFAAAGGQSSVLGGAVQMYSARDQKVPWKKLGPYLSERQWGTVREDYSDNGDAWSYFSHDQARSRAYHWGEDGLAGISDDKQLLCFSVALWNGKDPILKERMFGLTNSEANHGEDVKEYYFYLDSTPTHSYMKYLYKYPHAAFPYVDLIETNKGRNRGDMEYELLDTGVFEQKQFQRVVALPRRLATL
jgi:hypothetical protein